MKSKIIVSYAISTLCIFGLAFIFQTSHEESLNRELLSYQAQILTVIEQYETDSLNNKTYLSKNILDNLTNKNDVSLEILNMYGINEHTISEFLIHKNLNQKNYFIFAFLIWLLLSGLIYYIYRKFNHSIENANKYAMNILQENYDIPNVKYNHLTDNLNDSLYKMSSLIINEKNISKQDKLTLEQNLENIAHQLKTPLTTLSLAIDLMEHDPEKYKAITRTMIDKMEYFITTLLKLAKLESKSIVFREEKVCLKNFIESILQELSIFIEIHDKTIQLNISKKIITNFDLKWMKEAFLNILKNAITYSNSTITIEANENDLFAEITITNDLKDLNLDINHLFDRYYTNSEDINNNGIGLSLAKGIIENQKGTIKVKRENDQLIFMIKLYKNDI